MLKSLMDFLRRQFPIILFFVLIGIGLGVTYVLTAPPMFTAQTSMVIDTQKAQIFRRQEQPSGNTVIVSAMVDSEVEMLKSENVSLAVIKRFHLADDPEFIGRDGRSFAKDVLCVSIYFVATRPPPNTSVLGVLQPCSPIV